MPEITVSQAEPENQPDVKKPEAPSEVPPASRRADVSYKLPDGRTLKMGKPSIPTQVLLPDLAASYNEMAVNQGKKGTDSMALRLNLNYATMVCFVRAINNEPINVPRSAAEVINIMHKLGEDGNDAVAELYARHFAPLTLENLELIKKS